MIRTMPVIGLTLWKRRQLLAHDRWPRERLVAYQDRAIASLRAYAYERALWELGAIEPVIRVERVRAIPKGVSGKTPLIRALR